MSNTASPKGAKPNPYDNDAVQAQIDASYKDAPNPSVSSPSGSRGPKSPAHADADADDEEPGAPTSGKSPVETKAPSKFAVANDADADGDEEEGPQTLSKHITTSRKPQAQPVSNYSLPTFTKRGEFDNDADGDADEDSVDPENVYSAAEGSDRLKSERDVGPEPQPLHDPPTYADKDMSAVKKVIAELKKHPAFLNWEKPQDVEKAMGVMHMFHPLCYAIVRDFEAPSRNYEQFLLIYPVLPSPNDKRVPDDTPGAKRVIGDYQTLRKERILIFPGGVRLHPSWPVGTLDMALKTRQDLKALERKAVKFHPFMDREASQSHIQGYKGGTFVLRFSGNTPAGSCVLTAVKYFDEKPNVSQFKHRVLEISILGKDKHGPIVGLTEVKDEERGKTFSGLKTTVEAILGLWTECYYNKDGSDQRQKRGENDIQKKRSAAEKTKDVEKVERNFYSVPDEVDDDMHRQHAKQASKLDQKLDAKSSSSSSSSSSRGGKR